jgi:hypothetical protein
LGSSYLPWLFKEILSGRRALRLQIENGFVVIDDDLEWKLANLLYYIVVHINFSFNQRKILLYGG